MHLCQAQQKLGLEVEVISIGTPDIDEKVLETVLEEEGVACKKWRMKALPDLRESFKMIAYCKNTETDIMHSHGYKGNILLGLLPKSARSIPVVATVHGYTSFRGFGKLRLNQLLDRYCLRRLDSVVLVSEGMRNQVNEGQLKGKLHVVPNGIPDTVDRLAHYSIDVFKEGDFRIGAIGRLSPEKNFEMLIRCMKLVIEKVPFAKLVIYGEGSTRDRLENLIVDLDLHDNVFLPGYIDKPDALYQSVDVFVSSSLSEGMPITLIEALKNGCAIVATDINGNRALLGEVPEVAALVPFSEHEMAKRICDLASTTSIQRDSMSLKAKQLFKEKYTSHMMAKAYSDVYGLLMG